jgi:tRNA modification GTPase
MSQNEYPTESWRPLWSFCSRITGHVDVEDILDVVFGDFCIGK